MADTGLGKDWDADNERVAAITREELDGLTVMIYDAAGNAVEAFDWTPEALEEAASRLRRMLGEQTTITTGPSPFIVGDSNG